MEIGDRVKSSKYDDWTITGDPIHGHIADLWPAHSDRADLDVLIKIPRDQANLDLVEREQDSLNVLRAETDTTDSVPSLEAIERMKFKWFTPNLVDVAYVYDGTDIWTANLIETLGDGWYSLAEIRDRFPNGVNPKDAAWMWRRLLMALGFAHRQGIIHGAPVPENILIHPEKHGLTLIDWCYSVPIEHKPITAIVNPYRDWYPHEVLSKLTPEPCTDIHIAAKTWLWLMGDQADGKLRGFAQVCTFASRSRRPHDAWALRENFDTLIERLWGPRKFKEFKFP